MQEIARLLDAESKFALATLVSVSGSSPQNIGAKLIVLANGQLIGTIGGGCMEAEARRVSLDCLRTGKTKLFDLKLDDDFGWDDGLLCGGSVSIFIDPLPDRERYIFSATIQAIEEHQPVCRAVFLDDQGRPGSSAVIGAESLISTDTLAPDFESALRSSAAAAIEKGFPVRTELLGGADVYIEPILPRPTLLIAGAGHIGAALCTVGAICGFEVVIVDDRPSLANTTRLPQADKVAVEDIPAFMRSFTVRADTYIAIVTRGHRHDAKVLREAIHSKARYIGMIGSKRKVVVIFEELLKEGLATKEELRRVRSPMGLTLEDKEVGEIAVSIMAEIIAVRNGADLNNLRPMQYQPAFLNE